MVLPLPYLPKKTSCVAHYTKIGALPSILKKDSIVLWATKYGYFQDELEYIWPLAKIEPLIKDIATQFHVEYDPEHQTFPYILSFTNGIESEFMWKNYGEEGNGVMLVFDRVKLFDYCNSFMEETGKTRYCMDVIYATSGNLNSGLACAYNELQNNFPNTNPVEPLYDCPAFVKEKNRFYQENEFRLTHCAYEILLMSPETIDKPIVREEIPGNLKYRDSNGQKIPYVEIELPKDCLVAVCIGKYMSSTDTNAIQLLLRDNMYSAGMFQSRIKIK